MAQTTADMLTQADLPPADPAVETATRLMALAHRCADHDRFSRSGWWDALCDRARTACWTGPTLAHWWARMCAQLGCSDPSSAADRRLLADSLTADNTAVLAALAEQTEMITLRVRVAADTARQNRQESLDV